jgi:hypothetical protein
MRQEHRLGFHAVRYFLRTRPRWRYTGLAADGVVSVVRKSDANLAVRAVRRPGATSVAAVEKDRLMKHRASTCRAVTHQTMVLFLIIATLIVGSVSFLRLGNLEDPGFNTPP